MEKQKITTFLWFKGQVAEAARLLAKFQQFGPTIFGLNEKEAFRVGRSLGYECKACISERRQARIARVQ